MVRTSDGFRRRDRVARQRAQRRGRISEYVAAVYLMLKGYRVLAVRHRTKLGEIDLVARKGDLVVFVEVKARADARSALDAVSRESQGRIRAAGDIWLSKQFNFAQLSQRYDVIAVLPWRLPRHFPDAF